MRIKHQSTLNQADTDDYCFWKCHYIHSSFRINIWLVIYIVTTFEQFMIQQIIWFMKNWRLNWNGSGVDANIKIIQMIIADQMSWFLCLTLMLTSEMLKKKHLYECIVFVLFLNMILEYNLCFVDATVFLISWNHDWLLAIYTLTMHDISFNK